MNTDTVREYLQKLENDEKINFEAIAQLEKEGYINAAILPNNDGTIAHAAYQGLTALGKSTLND